MKYMYALYFCKIVVFLLFTMSFLSKLKNFSQFVDSVRSFRLLPQPLTWLVALFILMSELLVVFFLLKWQFIAFWLASGLLLVFSGALATILLRKIQVNCNCFGPNQHPVSPADLVRNLGFLICSCSGSWLAGKTELTLPVMSLGSVVTGSLAIAFVLVWTHLGEIYYLFQPMNHSVEWEEM